MGIQELRLELVKPHQYFRIFVREFEGGASSTGSMFTKEWELTFLYDVIGHVSTFWLVKCLEFAFSSAKILTQEWKK